VALGAAAKEGRSIAAMVKYLVEMHKINPSSNNNHALNHAALNGHIAVVKYIFSISSNVNYKLAIRRTRLK
jgi:ankyrin repeat protein